MNAVLTSIGSGRGDDVRDFAMSQHASLMQHHEVIVGRDFVEQMRRPEHADALLGDQLAHVAQNVGPRLDVEADGRLVEQQ